MDSETPSNLPQSPSSFDSRFSNPSPDFLQPSTSSSSMFSKRRTSRSIPSTTSRLSSTCSLTSCWILSSSEMILSLVFPVVGQTMNKWAWQNAYVVRNIICTTDTSAPRSVMTLLCFCTVCSSPFRVSLMELKVRMTLDSSPCRVFSWLLLIVPSITLWPSKGFSASRPGPCSLVPPEPPEPPGPPEPPPSECLFYIQLNHNKKWPARSIQHKQMLSFKCYVSEQLLVSYIQDGGLRP